MGGPDGPGIVYYQPNWFGHPINLKSRQIDLVIQSIWNLRPNWYGYPIKRKQSPIDLDTRAKLYWKFDYQIQSIKSNLFEIPIWFSDGGFWAGVILLFFSHLQIPSITSEGRSTLKMFLGLRLNPWKYGMIPCWGLLILLVTSGAHINKQTKLPQETVFAIAPPWMPECQF